MDDILTRVRAAAQELISALDAVSPEENSAGETQLAETLTPEMNRELERSQRGGRYSV